MRKRKRCQNFFFNAFQYLTTPTILLNWLYNTQLRFKLKRCTHISSNFSVPLVNYSVTCNIPSQIENSYRQYSKVRDGGERGLAETIICVVFPVSFLACTYSMNNGGSPTPTQGRNYVTIIARYCVTGLVAWIPRVDNRERELITVISINMYDGSPLYVDDV